MRSILGLLILLLFGLGYPIVGQDVRKTFELADLVGEWKLTSHQTRMRHKYSDGLVRITVKDNEVTLFRRLEDGAVTRERTFTLFADGRGEINRWIGDDGRTEIERKTKTNWKQGSLTSTWSYKTSMGWMNVEDRYRLSKDLLSLEYENVHRGAGPAKTDFSEKLVFTRK